ncbi:MAG: hypothetical protein KTR32_15860 [Granulosicoccus sp.]|nr:hypothetical protein [Granulosicoccus sp.]
MGALFLVQIPETAGSNLRLAACRLWGSNSIVSDYGPANRHTSEAVLELIHLEKDYHRFKTYLDTENIAMFTSHSPLRQLRRIFPVNDIVTFLRNPVDLVISRYDASVREGYKGDLLSFASNRVHQNIQSRFLHSVPLELLGFVGLSERFAESLTLLNAQYDCNLSELTATTAGPEHQDCSAKIKQQIAKLNQDDIELYETAKQLFETRLQLIDSETPYVHGRVQRLNETTIQGWAVASHSDEPCKIRLHVNDTCVAIMPATEYLPTLKERNVSRDGYVGFSYQFKKQLAPKDEVACYIHCSEQLLTGPRRVTK